MDDMREHKYIQVDMGYIGMDLIRMLNRDLQEQDRSLWSTIILEFLNDNAGAVAYFGRDVMASIIAAAKRRAVEKIESTVGE